MSDMFIVAIGALTNDAKFFGPYGGEGVAERARDELAQQGHEGTVRPLTNGLLAYRDMQGAVESHASDPYNDWTHPKDRPEALTPRQRAIRQWEPVAAEADELRRELRAAIAALPHPQNDIDQDLAQRAVDCITRIGRLHDEHPDLPGVQFRLDDLKRLMLGPAPE